MQNRNDTYLNIPNNPTKTSAYRSQTPHSDNNCDMPRSELDCSNHETKNFKTTRNATQENDNQFLSRVVFDRDEILRKHYNIVKTDKELIEEALGFFSKRLDCKEIANSDREREKDTLKSSSCNGARPNKLTNPVFQPNNFAKNKRARVDLSVNNVSNNNNNIFRDISTNNEKKAVGNKRYGVLSNNKQNVGESTKQINLNNDCQESRKQDNAGLTCNPEKNSYEDLICTDEMDALEADDKLIFYETNAAVKNSATFNFGNESQKLISNSGSRQNQIQNFLSVSTVEIEQSNILKVRDPKRILMRNGRPPLDKIRISDLQTKRQGNIKIIEEKNSDGDAKSDNLSNISSYESIDIRVCKDCHCAELKKMADQLNTKFDSKFIAKIRKALNIEPENAHDSKSILLDDKSKILSKQILKKPHIINGIKKGLYNKENSNTTNLDFGSQNYRSNAKAQDKLNSFKRQFMKTEF